jgi:uncharacterized protein (TIGR02270 family)
MAATYTAFLRDLYEEHLDEASFLYLQRQQLLTAPEPAWLEVEDFEERLEAHLDALVVGGDLATETCQARVAAGDAGDLFAGVSTFCRRVQAPLLAGVFKTLDYEDRDKSTALTDALKYELADEWIESCVRALGSSHPSLVSILAVAMGYRRMPIADALSNALRTAAPAAVPGLLWSLGRVGGVAAAPLVRPFIRAADTATASAALHSGLRLQDREVFRDVLSAPEAGVPALALGLAGGRRAVPQLLAALRNPGQHGEIISALGLLGDLSAVRPLVELLSVDPVGGAAADALHVITGAPLFEDTILPDLATEEELFPEELADFRGRGQAPRRPDGRPFGPVVLRLSRDSAVWREWLATNASRFVAERRYRSGTPYAPGVLLECLRSASFPKSYRAWIGEELLIRYGLDIRFEADLPVRQQRRVLAEAEGAPMKAAAGVEPGRWYFAGQII